MGKAGHTAANVLAGNSTAKLRSAFKKAVVMTKVVKVIQVAVEERRAGGMAPVRAVEKKAIVDEMVSTYNSDHSNGNVLSITEILIVNLQIVRGTKCVQRGRWVRFRVGLGTS